VFILVFRQWWHCEFVILVLNNAENTAASDRSVWGNNSLLVPSHVTVRPLGATRTLFNTTTTTTTSSSSSTITTTNNHSTTANTTTANNTTNTTTTRTSLELR